jgi:hypothetical protein
VFIKIIYFILLKIKMDKEILFISQSCVYSREAMTLIAKNNIQNLFHIRSIEDPNTTIPAFVDRVPTLINKNKEILINDRLFNYINFIINEKNKQNQQNQQTNQNINYNQDQQQQLNTTRSQPPSQDANITPYFSELSSGFSDSYSYIENAQDNPHARTFSYLDSNIASNSFSNNSSIITPDETVVKSKSDKNDYERFIKDRESDVYTRGPQRV